LLGILTDSRAPGEPKDTEGSNIFSIYQAFATAEETNAMRVAFAEGIAWGDAKQRLFERIDAELSEPRERYDALMARPDEIEDRLQVGARKARERSAPFLAALRESVGLSSRVPAAKGNTPKSKTATAAPLWKRYREKDSRFYFKLVDGEGVVLLQSGGFERPDECGRLIDTLMNMAANAGSDQAADWSMQGKVEVLASTQDVKSALSALAAIQAEKQAAKASAN
jgi:tryptophanyl-tRNA synthetase